MAFIGVNIAIIDRHRVLLTQREDFEVWCLPGGHVDPGESVAQAAVREAREETGLDVTLDQLVGIYSTPRWAEGGAHIVVFTAHAVGGELARQQDEVLDMGWLALDERALDDPAEPLMWPHRQRIDDAAAAVRGERVASAWLQDLVWPGGGADSLKMLYPLRDASGLGRLAFWQQHLGAPGELGEVREVGPQPLALEPLTLSTPRLIMREYREEDWRVVLAYQSDPRFMRWYPVQQYTEGNAREFVGMFLGWQRETPRYRFQLAITDRETGEVIGSCGVRRDGPTERTANLGYELAPARWGNGLATEAATAMLTWAFGAFDLHRVWARVLANNHASANVLSKLGFTQEGRLRQHADMSDATRVRGRDDWRDDWRDELLYGILADEWHNRLKK